MIIIINNNTSTERDERASEFLFRSQGKREREEGIAFLDVVVVVVSFAIEHFTCSCLCCVCVCVAGRYCFRLIAAVVVDFSPLLFTHTHTHTCRSFSSFILLPKKTRNIFHSSYIRIYFNSFFSFFFFLCHNSSFLLICCIPFSPLLNLFSLSN